MKFIIKKIDRFFNKEISRKEKDLIKSVYIVNSLARGDFIKGVSDVDILIIFRGPLTYEEGGLLHKKILKQISEHFRNLSSSHFGDLIDIPWEIEGKYEKSKLNCFRFFFDDLKKHNIHVYGEDILRGLNIKGPTNHMRQKRIIELKRLLKNIKNPKKHNLFTGAAIRQYLFTIGVTTLNKDKIIIELKKREEIEILDFYEKYIKNKTNNREQIELNKRILAIL